MRLPLLCFLLSIYTISCVSPIGFGRGIGREVTNQLNRASDDRPNKPGTCYGKCTIPDNTITLSQELFVFTGNPLNTNVALKEVEIVVRKGESTWVKKKADSNCRSANPDDCLVWCLVDVPEEKETFTTVVDTSATDEYKKMNIETKSVLSKGGEPEWREVVCPGKITKEMMMKVQNILFAEGLYLGSINGELSEDTMKALRQFQFNNELPTGQLDFETLDFMGVSY